MNTTVPCHISIPVMDILPSAKLYRAFKVPIMRKAPAPHAANHLRQPPLIRKAGLREVTLRRPLWPYHYGRIRSFSPSSRVWAQEGYQMPSFARKPYKISLCRVLVSTTPAFMPLRGHPGWPIPVFMRVCGLKTEWS